MKTFMKNKIYFFQVLLMAEKITKIAEEAVLVHGTALADYNEVVEGYDWSQGISYEGILNSYLN
jgi:hypothetical protein